MTAPNKKAVTQRVLVPHPALPQTKKTVIFVFRHGLEPSYRVFSLFFLRGISRRKMGNAMEGEDGVKGKKKEEEGKQV